MPTYVYKFVETGETIEVQQAFTDDPLTEYTHPDTGDVMAVKKVFLPVGITFKGSGFFKTDNRRAKSGSSNGSPGSESSGGSGDSRAAGSSSAPGSSASGSSASGSSGSGSSKTADGGA